LKQGPRNFNFLHNAKERNLEKVISCTVKKGLKFKTGRLQELYEYVVAMWNWGTISAFGSS